MEAFSKVVLIVILVAFAVYLLTLFYHWIRFYIDYHFIVKVRTALDYMKSDEWYVEMLDLLNGRGLHTNSFIPYSHTNEEKEGLIEAVRFLNRSRARFRIVNNRYQCRCLPTHLPPDWLEGMGFAFILFYADVWCVLSLSLLEARLDERREFALSLLNPSVLLSYIIKVLKEVWLDVISHFRSGD